MILTEGVTNRQTEKNTNKHTNKLQVIHIIFKFRQQSWKKFYTFNHKTFKALT